MSNILTDQKAKDDEKKRKLQNKQEEKRKAVKKEILSWISVVVIAAAIAAFVNLVIIANSIVPTSSMENTIMAGERVVGLRLTYYFSEPKRGDIAIFKYPDNRKVFYIKRVIGVPGDVVEIDNNKVYINGELQEEDYIKEEMITHPGTPSYMRFEVPEDCYFFMGDNRNDSLDARFWRNTYVPKKDVIAKVYFKYWPFPMKKVE